MTLNQFGWSSGRAETFQAYSLQSLVPGRVTLHHRHLYQVQTEAGVCMAGCTGRLLHSVPSPAALPVVGDWVALRPRQNESFSTAFEPMQADIHAVLQRTSVLERRAAGSRPVKQVLAANVDTVFVVTGLDEDFSLRRIERYMAVARAGGVAPVFLLNKADLHPAPAKAVAQVASVVQGAPVVLLSALHGEGLAVLEPWLSQGCTVALLGSSGVGKSTLLNRLLGVERQEVGAISEAVGNGCHTTTRRELIPLGSGAMVIDTPGLRELQFWNLDETALMATFDDIEGLAADCRYRDCTHLTEPGCAVQRALEDGLLDEARWESYLKLQKERAYSARKCDPVMARRERDRWKHIQMGHRQRERLERDLE